MCAGGGGGSVQGRYRRSIPEIHFRSDGPSCRAINDNVLTPQRSSGPLNLILATVKLVTSGAGLLVTLALRLRPLS